MKKYKATEKFKELGIDNSYQGLETWQYYDLRNGKEIEIEYVPFFLLDHKFVEEVKEEIKEEVKEEIKKKETKKK